MLVYYTDNFMLSRLGEQEAATDLDIVVKIHTCQRVGNKNSEVFPISELSVSLMSWAIGFPRWKSYCPYSLSLMIEDVLEFLKQSVPHIYQYMKLWNIYQDCWVWERPRTREGLETSMGCCESCFDTWVAEIGVRSDSKGPILLEVSVANRDRVWCLLQKFRWLSGQTSSILF